MRALAWVAAALLLATLQAALLRHLGGGAVGAALAVPLVVHLALSSANLEGAVASAGIGWVLDLTVGTPKGLCTFLAVVLFLVMRLAGAAVDLRGRAAFALASAGAVLGMGLAAMVLQRAVMPPELAAGWGGLPRLLGEAVVTGLVAPLLQLGARRLDALFGAEEPDLIG